MSNHPNTSNSPPAWFDREIRQGIATMYALGLEGVPAADTLTATAKLWVGDLWSLRGSVWTERDASRIEAGFRLLRTRSRRWPQMADLLGAIPDPEPVTALPRRLLSPEEAARSIARIEEICAALAGRRPIDPLETDAPAGDEAAA
jgi:hypothetical protein